jgi:hypothetical protein
MIYVHPSALVERVSYAIVCCFHPFSLSEMKKASKNRNKKAWKQENNDFIIYMISRKHLLLLIAARGCVYCWKKCYFAISITTLSLSQVPGSYIVI